MDYLLSRGPVHKTVSGDEPEQVHDAGEWAPAHDCTTAAAMIIMAAHDVGLLSAINSLGHVSSEVRRDSIMMMPAS